MKQAKLFVTHSVTKIAYQCPHCDKLVEYQTDSLPFKSECWDCLKPIEFEIIYLNDDEQKYNWRSSFDDAV